MASTRPQDNSFKSSVLIVSITGEQKGRITSFQVRVGCEFCNRTALLEWNYNSSSTYVYLECSGMTSLLHSSLLPLNWLFCASQSGDSFPFLSSFVTVTVDLTVM
jgi:hypothetical protein